MMSRLILASFILALLAFLPTECLAADRLTVDSDFQGASVRVLEIDDAAGSIRFMPGGDPERGWPCWWCFRVDGISPGETITLRLRGSLEAIGKLKPLAASWAMPTQATWSVDGETWLHTERGQRQEEDRMDVFLDLHNPAPGDPTFFYVLPREMLNEPMLSLRDRFIELAYARISKIKPLIPMSNKPKVSGPDYHPLWRQISSNWVSMNGNPHTVSLCLETVWNSEHSTTTGYRAVGANLAAAVREFLAERPPRR